MIKKIFLDVETTSLIKERTGLWQLGGIIDCGKRQREFSFKCDIFDEDDVNPDTMKMHNLTIKDLAKLPDPTEVFEEFQALLASYVDRFDKQDKFYFINFGAEFDSEVVRQWFLKNGDEFYGSWFWHPPIDIMPLAMQDLIGKRHELKNFRLDSVCRYYGIEVDDEKIHDALYDAIIARELYRRVVGEK